MAASIFSAGSNSSRASSAGLASTICSMRSMAPISASPVFTSDSYCRREMKIRTQEGTDQPSARGKLAALHAFMQLFRPGEVAVTGRSLPACCIWRLRRPTGTFLS